MADLTYNSLTNSQDRGIVARTIETLRQWRRRVGERNELARFTDRELRDIGITRAEATVEIRKPLWRE